MSVVLKAAWFGLIVAMPGLAVAQAPLVERTRAAMVVIEQATEDLAEAEAGRDQVEALTEAIVAFERGLAALRGSVREVSARQSALEVKLARHNDEIAALLSALQRVGGTRSPVVHLHPGGPLGTVRAGMLVADMTPAMNARAAGLRQDLEDLARLRELQNEASAQLEGAVLALQAARVDLNAALANRTAVPARFSSDPVREAILISSVGTLGEFAAGLDELSADQIAETTLQVGALKGTLDLPVTGAILRRHGEPDAAGFRRSGLVLQTAPQALVVSPVPATLRYVGPLLDFGTVVILEPQEDVLFIFAGLASVYGTTGELVSGGAPLGLMGPGEGKSATGTSTDGDGAGTDRAETLYIEIREHNVPQDPTLWFDTHENG